MDTEHTRQRIRGLLVDIERPFVELPDGSVQTQAGTTAVGIAVEEASGHTIVVLCAHVLVDAHPTPVQLAGLLEANASLRFGKFSWHSETRLLTVDYELVGDTLDRDELDLALQSVSEIADKSDERLRPLLGGRLPHGV